jgi:hypothetical protein
MRHCPFCSAENADELAVCQACGRRLPPLPPRKGRNAPPTGITLPNRPPPPPTPTPVRPAGPAVPPAPPAGPPSADPAHAVTPATGSVTAEDRATEVSAPPVIVPEDDGRAELLNALNPGPAATRREAPSEPRIIGDRRGLNDPKQPLSPTAFARARNPSSQPPPIASTPASQSPIPGMGPPAAPRPHTPSPPPAPSQHSTQMFAGVPPLEPSPFSLPPPPAAFDGTDFYTRPSAEPIQVMAERLRTGATPPPTRTQRADVTDRPFTPPRVQPVPEIPEPGLVNAAKYTYEFAIAWWQRRGAIRQLGVEIKQDTEALDQVLGALGRAARGARIQGKVFSVENTGISAAEERVAQLQKENSEVEARKAEENSKFVDIERERNEKLADADRQVEEGQRELTQLEAQRRSLRDKRKEVERRQKAYLKSAEDHDRQAGTAPMGDQRQEMRRAAEGHRREAAALEPDRQEVDRRLGSLDRPISEATAKVDAAKAELDAAKRSLNDAREGHTHRLAELDAEQKRKSREIALAEGEIARRLVTLGTLVNLNRIEDPQFAELYMRIDRLRGAITARTTEIEKLAAEREAKDNGTFWRGVATIGAAFMLLILLIVILRAIL